MEIHGFCDERFLPLKDAFRANFEDGLEVGASLAVMHQGKPVVDLWAGYADKKRTRPWQRDTIVLVYSTTKVATTLAFLMLIDRGVVDLDATVASYWPEFAAGGKHRVSVRDALTHRAGVPGFEPPVTLPDLYDWDAAVARIAAEPHWFGGRTVPCYHAITYGFVLGEIMRRVDGRLPSQFFREEIAEPAHIDFTLALQSPHEIDRVADLVALSPLSTAEAADPLGNRAFNSVVIAGGEWSTRECQRADIPSSNGHGNARAIARLCSIGALSGELDGRRYLSKDIIDEASSLQVDAVDLVLGPMRLGLGFGLHSKAFPAPTPTCFHWGGFGGSSAVMDQRTGVSFGYAMNNLVVEDQLLDRRHARLWPVLGEIMAKL